MTPRAGEHAGELGPWSRLVSAAGLDPRSGLVKSAHVVLGFAWLAAAAGLALRPSRARWALATCAIASLWYLPFGTLIGAIVLLLLPFLRSG